MREVGEEGGGRRPGVIWHSCMWRFGRRWLIQTCMELREDVEPSTGLGFAVGDEKSMSRGEQESGAAGGSKRVCSAL